MILAWSVKRDIAQVVRCVPCLCLWKGCSHERVEDIRQPSRRLRFVMQHEMASQLMTQLIKLIGESLAPQLKVMRVIAAKQPKMMFKISAKHFEVMSRVPGA